MLYLLTSKGRQNRRTASCLYQQVVKQSRQPALYSEFSVPDTAEGRFEMISLFGGLLVNRLCQPDMGRDGKLLAQAVFDVMFRSLDLSIREMGVGDLAVPRRIKKMMSNFKGRAFAYDEAFKSGQGEMVHALSRNIFMNDKPSEMVLKKFADYVHDCVQTLNAQSVHDFVQGKILFPPLDPYTPDHGSFNANQAA